jgi:RNA polymerase sigma-70 factor (ECF subfamily)
MSKLAVSTENVQPSRAGFSPEEKGEFVRAFNEWRSELVSTLYYVLGNVEDAQDAAQDAFLKCWRSQDGLGEVRNLKAWVFRIGLNAAKDMQRNAWRRRAKTLGDQPPPETTAAPSPADAVEERETQQRLREALMGLRPEEKEVFLLRQNGGMTYEEIAEARRLPVGTVKTQMRSALQKLRSVLVEANGDCE